MSEINTKCLETFPHWLRTLDEDVQTLLGALGEAEIGDSARRYLTGGINYLFKSLDLIPDGIDDIGYLDDAFVIRLSAKAAMETEIGAINTEILSKLGALANESDLLSELLGADLADRLEKYTRDLHKGAARGRTVDEIVGDEDIFREFAAEAKSFAEEYTSPGFAKDEKNLIKLKAFLEAKLPK
jgi:uncharacterized membrane protein YkvA (DUF1232 family)